MGLRRETVEIGDGIWFELTEPSFGHYRRHMRPPADEPADWGLDLPARLLTAAGNDDGEISLPALGAGKWLEARIALLDNVGIGDYILLQEAAARLSERPTEEDRRQLPPQSASSERAAVAD